MYTGSQLADRVAALQAENALLRQTSPPPATRKAAETTDTSDESTRQLKLDLAESLRANGQLQSKFKAADTDLQSLRAKSKVDEKRLRDLTIERNLLAGRLKDRNEELVGKNKLLKVRRASSCQRRERLTCRTTRQDVQDESLTLNIQMNIMEQNIAKVTAENKELIDRWLKSKAREADAMNLANDEPRSPRHGR
jgi:hypothetical protein